MKLCRTVNNQQGFTLIEIIAVLVLLGILAAVAVPKYLDLTTSAKKKAIDAGIAELNSRESVTWGNQKLAATPPATASAMDDAVVAAMDTNLGADYKWGASWGAGASTKALTSATGADTTYSLIFQSDDSITTITRTGSTLTAPGTWKK